MANGQKQAKKDKENGRIGNDANKGKIIPIDSKTSQVQSKPFRSSLPIVDDQKKIENELAALDKLPLSELVDAALYSIYKDVRKKAIYLIAEKKDVGILKTILYQSGYPDTEATAKSLIDSITNPKPQLPDAGTS